MAILMPLTLTSTTPPATDLGYLLYKNPARVQTFELSFGQAHIFYPEATPERCTAALLLDVDPVHLVRGQHSMDQQYVNDRPYVVSSYMSVAIAQVLGSALSGQWTACPRLGGTGTLRAPRAALSRSRVCVWGVGARKPTGGSTALRAQAGTPSQALPRVRRPSGQLFPRK